MTVFFDTLKTGYPDPPANQPRPEGAWHLVTVCERLDKASSLAIKDISALKSQKDIIDARATLHSFQARANTGQSMAGLYDEKQCHEALIFFCQATHSDEKVFRLRGAGDIRVYFFYLPNKVIVILKIIAKRANKLTSGQEKELRDLVEKLTLCIIENEFSKRFV